MQTDFLTRWMNERAWRWNLECTFHRIASFKFKPHLPRKKSLLVIKASNAGDSNWDVDDKAWHATGKSWLLGLGLLVWENPPDTNHNYSCWDFKWNFLMQFTSQLSQSTKLKLDSSNHPNLISERPERRQALQTWLSCHRVYLSQLSPNIITSLSKFSVKWLFDMIWSSKNYSWTPNPFIKKPKQFHK